MRYRFERKKTITVIVIAAVMLILGGAYLWYAHNYGNAENITLTSPKIIEYEWQECAADHGITLDYLWSRTKELMVTGGEDGVLIPSSYMIAGRLSYEDAEESGVYLLSDQGRLLMAYVRSGDRFKATALKNEVLNRFDLEAESVSEKMFWLEAYLNYYVSYGNAEDYTNITSLIATLFDDQGMVVPDTIYVVSYDEGSTLYLEEQSGSYQDSIIDDPLSETTTAELNAVQGVVLSSIRLSLIRDLENNNLLPAGSYERNLDIVLGGQAPADIPLFAYAYTICDPVPVVTDEGGSTEETSVTEAAETTAGSGPVINYIYSHDVPAAIDVGESIAVMRNLAAVDSLPDGCYSWIKNRVVNGYTVNSEYYLVSGSTDGAEATDALTDILAIAFYKDDLDLFDRVCTLIGSRVATYTDSPALSMIYRQKDDRFYFSARENLEVCLALM